MSRIGITAAFDICRASEVQAVAYRVVNKIVRELCGIGRVAVCSYYIGIPADEGIVVLNVCLYRVGMSSNDALFHLGGVDNGVPVELSCDGEGGRSIRRDWHACEQAEYQDQ